MFQFGNGEIGTTCGVAYVYRQNPRYVRFRVITGARKAGTRMLLYETAAKRLGVTTKGTMFIIGEIEVTGSFEDGEKLRAPTEEHDRLVPAKVLRPRRDGKSIPLKRVRELIEDPDWPRRGEAWKPLAQAVYEQLCAELEQ